MGSNIHITYEDADKPLAPFPKELEMYSDSSSTLPRYSGSREFMSLLWKNCISIPTCGCRGEHDYFCDYANKARPVNFSELRQKVKELDLQEVFFVLIDYLESEPNAYLEYD
jgi:hypothetical protein